MQSQSQNHCLKKLSKKSCIWPITLESCQTVQCEVSGPGLSVRKTEIRKHPQLRFSDQG